MINNLSKE